jgi:hypothetical protein
MNLPLGSPIPIGVVGARESGSRAVRTPHAPFTPSSTMRASDSGVYVSVMSAADDKKLTEWYFDDDELDEKGVPRRRRIIPWLYGQVRHRLDCTLSISRSHGRTPSTSTSRWRTSTGRASATSSSCTGMDVRSSRTRSRRARARTASSTRTIRTLRTASRSASATLGAARSASVYPTSRAMVRAPGPHDSGES